MAPSSDATAQQTTSASAAHRSSRRTPVARPYFTPAQRGSPAPSGISRGWPARRHRPPERGRQVPIDDPSLPGLATVGSQSGCSSRQALLRLVLSQSPRQVPVNGLVCALPEICFARRRVGAAFRQRRPLPPPREATGGEFRAPNDQSCSRETSTHSSLSLEQDLAPARIPASIAREAELCDKRYDRATPV